MGDHVSRRLHPKLRVLANGSDSVNAMRAPSSSCVAANAEVTNELAAQLTTRVRLTEAFAAGQLDGEALKSAGPAPKRQKLRDAGVASRSFVNVFVETQHTDPHHRNTTMGVVEAIQSLIAKAAPPPGEPALPLSRRNFVSATVPISALPDIAGIPGVSYVHHAESLNTQLPLPDLSREGSPSPRSVVVSGKRQKGEGVLIGIIDVGGFDFAHPDFLDDAGGTRFLSIWDQGGDFRAPPPRFGYGAEFSQDRLNAAIRAAKNGDPPAVLLEEQSQRVLHSHGTHVASIAAGNAGVCPGAKIAGVIVSVPELEDRRTTFSDASRLVHAVEYLLDLAEKEQLPVSINISLGTNGGAHDGSSGTCRWFDSALSTPGRAICVAAGNAGQEKAAYRDDLGWIMGRIHTSGQVPSRGLDVDLEWVVVGDGIADVSENEMEIWYGAQDRMMVSVLPPGATDWITVRPREYVENRPLQNGTILSIYNELYHPTNGDNYISIYLSPRWDPDAFTPVAPGIWKVRLHGDEVRDGRFHAWIERDDPMEIDRRNGLAAYRFPSYFSASSNVDSHSIGSLGCSHRVVAVANHDPASGRMNISSSQGPTRDGRNKPDIAAPGTNIVAASGFNVGKKWVPMSGTSMASPFVCGVIGLMLAAKPTLNAAQCLGILRRTARPLPSHGYDWRNDAGYGMIDPVAAIEEAREFDQRTERR